MVACVLCTRVYVVGHNPTFVYWLFASMPNYCVCVYLCVYFCVCVFVCVFLCVCICVCVTRVCDLSNMVKECDCCVWEV